MRHDEPASSPTKRRHPLSTTVKFKRLLEEASLPEYKTEYAAGMDIAACIPDGPRKLGITPGDMVLVPCGFAMELEPGFEAQIRPRSSGPKNFMIVPNAPGTIDADFRGELKVWLYNAGKTTFVVEHGDRIAQMVICVLPRVERIEVTELSETSRGEGGFGSTGSR
jgi:dUTP pyrophosphatase